MFKELETNDSTAKMMQPLALAMIGDAVHTLYVRNFIAVRFGVKVNKINKLVSSVVYFAVFSGIAPAAGTGRQ